MKVILKKTPLYESFDFDSDEDKNFNFDDVIESRRYKKFIEDNYDINGGQVKTYKKDGELFIDVDGDVKVKNKKLTSLTNGLFCFGKVAGNFTCPWCNSLTSLEGAPEKVGEDFYCSDCKSLTSLEGAPEKVCGHFYCNDCNSLTSLEGAPKYVAGVFYCYDCDSLKTIDLPATTKINGEIIS